MAIHPSMTLFFSFLIWYMMANILTGWPLAILSKCLILSKILWTFNYGRAKNWRSRPSKIWDRSVILADQSGKKHTGAPRISSYILNHIWDTNCSVVHSCWHEGILSLNVTCSTLDVVSFVVLTFVCTAIFTIINNKSNIERFIGIFIFRKQVSATALITPDNYYKRN